LQSEAYPAFFIIAEDGGYSAFRIFSGSANYFDAKSHQIIEKPVMFRVKNYIPPKTHDIGVPSPPQSIVQNKK
jgi:hypothetical protein